MVRSTKFIFFALITFALVSTTACDKVGKFMEEKQQQATQALQDAADKSANDSGANTGKALSQYVDAENDILRINSRHGVEGALGKFKGKKYAEATGKVKNPDTFFSNSALNSAVEHLEKAQGFKIAEGPYSKMATVGAELLNAAKPFAKTNEELTQYFESKAYLEDDFAKGRELAPKFEAEAEAFVKAYQAFNVESSKVEVIRNDELVKGLKNNKAFARAAGYETYGYFLGFANTATKEDRKDEAVIAKLDKYIADAAASLETFKVELEKPENEKSRSNLKSVYDDELSLLGEMRTAKAKKYNDSSISSFLDSYNRFVQFTLNFGKLDR